MSAQSRLTETDLREDIGRYIFDPVGYATYAFPWGRGALRDHRGPRDWQHELLSEVGYHLQNPETRYQPLLLARASGHGIGKSALIAMLSKWGLDTCDDCRIVVTSNTEGQLRTKTVPEITKWHRMAVTAHWFNTTTTAVMSTQQGHEKSWRMDMIPWSKENSEAFAGLHNAGKRIIVIFDEASAIANEIWEVTEGALTDANTEIIWIAFGNPTRATGAFRECFRKNARYWRTKHIDSRDVEGTNQALFDRWAEQYGEDSDFFRMRVKGQFPSQSARQLYSTALLDAAWGKHLRPEQYNFAPKILTCDPAWTGEDDLVIALRQGLYYQILDVLPHNDNDFNVANRLARLEDAHQADAVFIDGGFGTGIVSAGRTMGRPWQIVWFSEKSNRADCINKRAEMAMEALDWLKAGGAIPKDQTLYDELEAIETVPTLDGKVKLMSKEDMKDAEVLGWSPNRFDSLILSFAHPVQKRTPQLPGSRNNSIDDYDPYDNA